MKFLSGISSLLLMLLLPFSSYALSADDDVDQVKKALKSLEKEFKNIKSIASDFTQTKKMSLFNRNIILKGRLLIKFPHYFRWEVDEPVKTTVTASGDSIKIWDEESGETQTTSTKNNPVVKNIWAQIDSWFMGKYLLLAKDYNISTLKNEETESDIPLLVFKPKSKPLSVAVQSVTLYFEKATPETSGRQYLKRVILKEKSGDSTVIDFDNVKISLQSKQ
jgi:outer membrane lipoprotein carrier protein